MYSNTRIDDGMFPDADLVEEAAADDGGAAFGFDGPAVSVKVGNCDIPPELQQLIKTDPQLKDKKWEKQGYMSKHGYIMLVRCTYMYPPLHVVSEACLLVYSPP
jgi:hypothetical protein